MAIARYKDLCIDALDPERLGQFYAEVLGLDLHRQQGGDAYLTGPTPQHTVWINGVPEAKSVKHRVHLDVWAHAVADVERAGATIVEVFPRWTVMRDPEDGELCVFTPDQPRPVGIKHVVVDCADHRSIAAWWHRIVGGNLVNDQRGYSRIERIEGAPFESLDFIPVPDAKAMKNRVHIDLTTADVGQLVTAGATTIRERDEEISWTVMADPDGNEFCAFVV